MTATITNLPNLANPSANPPPNPTRPARHRPGGLDPESAKDRRKAARLARGDLAVAARLLYVAAETYRRVVRDPGKVDAIERVRADLMAVLAGQDTPSEIRYGDLAADASAYADEVEKLREELEDAEAPARHGQ